jgi:hypothetical protein
VSTSAPTAQPEPVIETAEVVLDEPTTPVESEVEFDQAMVLVNPVPHDFHGVNLFKVTTTEGEVYLSILEICEDIGVSSRSQIRSMTKLRRGADSAPRPLDIQKFSVLRKDSDGTLRTREMSFINRKDAVPWLTSIDASKVKDEEAKVRLIELRAKAEATLQQQVSTSDTSKILAAMAENQTAVNRMMTESRALSDKLLVTIMAGQQKTQDQLTELIMYMQQGPRPVATPSTTSEQTEKSKTTIQVIHLLKRMYGRTGVPRPELVGLPRETAFRVLSENRLMSLAEKRGVYLERVHDRDRNSLQAEWYTKDIEETIKELWLWACAGTPCMTYEYKKLADGRRVRTAIHYSMDDSKNILKKAGLTAAQIKERLDNYDDLADEYHAKTNDG